MNAPRVNPRVPFFRWSALGAGSLVCAAGMLFSPGADAQTTAPGQSPSAAHTKPQVPPGPLLGASPDFSVWSTQFTYSDEHAGAAGAGSEKTAAATHQPPRTRKIATTKTREIIHEEVTDTDGKQSDKWYSGQTQFTKPPNQPIWFGVNGADPNASRNVYFSEPLSASGFRGFAWVTTQNYAGTIPYKGDSKALVFVPGGSDVADLSDPDAQRSVLGAQRTIAYIDAATRLPIMIKAGGETRVFEFGNPPAAMQTLPMDLTNQIKKGEEARARLGQPAMRPY